MFWGALASQDLNTSPFTRFGLGELSNQFTAHYQGMGGLSVSLADKNQINISNPATYGSFVKNNPIFNVGVSGKFSSYESEYNGEKNQSSGSNIGLNNMLLGLPLTKDLSISLGIFRYSSIGYDISNTTLLGSDTVTFNYNGDGSINKILLGTGYNIINKGDTTRFSIGLNTSYMFGVINRNNSVIFNEGTFYNTRIQNRMMLSGLSFDAGVHFFQQIKGRAENDRWFWQFGATQCFSSTLSAKRDFYAYTFVYNYSFYEIPKDTTSFYEDQKGDVTIPDKFSVGLNIGRNKQNRNVWTLGVQYNIHNWDIYKELFEGQDVTLNNLSQLSELIIGARIIPSLDWSSKNKNILQKSSYSCGFRYGKSFIELDDKQLTNYGINIGMSIPLLSSRSVSLINLAFEFGKLGNLEENLIEENYCKFSLGFSLAPDTRYDRWFKKRKYD